MTTTIQQISEHKTYTYSERTPDPNMTFVEYMTEQGIPSSDKLLFAECWDEMIDTNVVETVNHASPVKRELFIKTLALGAEYLDNDHMRDTVKELQEGSENLTPKWLGTNQ